ncbi:hypothetical protein RXV86_20970 [Alisedimentitalea sp. MJ-SS2]|uniref:hypothetical protein n=1 Tax=Aliisedimentitalea sp. MJ-SS2 TaxID=3049795 RepID=UPI0029114379|nr:hypothetical protein [Alisedimentitalea sp. MJ-SS2]MDU8929866.1 hypothetical protein [Alisedimentitalea sp. MJ-SS2]
MTSENPSDTLEKAIRVIEDLDTCHDLHKSVPILLFTLSGAFALRSFFWQVDLMTWFGLARLDPVLPSSLAFIGLFMVWVLTFLICMSILQKMRFIDLQMVATTQLSKLDLTMAERAGLHRLISAGDWRHESVLIRAIDALVPVGH